MEDASRALGAESLLYELENPFEVVDESLPVMMVQTMRRILSVIAEVEENQIVTRAQWLPERQIAINGQPVAVAQGKSRPVGISVAADADYRAVFHLGVDRSERRRHLDYQFKLLD